MASLEGHVRLTAAIIAGNDPAMDRAAGNLVANIRAEASKHNLTSAFMRSWHVAKAPGLSGPGVRVTDRIVYSDDPGAMAINYGHTARSADGSETRVPGKHVVEAAIARTSG